MVTTPRPRLASVAALRDLTVAAMLLVNDPGDWRHVFWPLDHAPWNGCTPTNFIFPMFLFIMVIRSRLRSRRAWNRDSMHRFGHYVWDFNKADRAGRRSGRASEHAESDRHQPVRFVRWRVVTQARKSCTYTCPRRDWMC